MMFIRTFLLICIFSPVLSKTLNISNYLINEYTGTSFNRFIQHNISRHIYISDNNSLILLNDNFELLNENRTSLMNVLVVDYKNNALITCGGGNDGRCEVHSLADLTKDDSVNDVVGLGNLHVGFIADEPTDKYRFHIASVGSPDVLSSLKLNPPNVETEIKIKQDYMNSIKFVTGFQHKGFNYFVSNREGHPRLSRFCSRLADPDNYLYTYSEIYLQCIDTNDYEFTVVRDMKVEMVGPTVAGALGLLGPQKVFFGVFSSEEQDGSALCMFTMDAIEDSFFKAIDGCYTGKVPAEYKLDYAVNAKCPETAVNVSKSIIKGFICQQSSIGVKYSQGIKSEAASSQTVLQLSNVTLTSVIVAVEDDNTVAFLGTQHGKLIKAHVNNASSARVYETLIVDQGHPVKADSILDATNLTILTETKLLRIRVESCSHYTNCNDCVAIAEGGGDPFCGWCTLDSTCSRRRECTTDSWIPSGSSECIAIVGITPEFLSIMAQTNAVHLRLSQLPPNQNYTCKLEGNAVETNTLSSSELVCGPFTHPPAIPAGDVEVKSLLSIHTNSGTQIVGTQFAFYNCSAITSCSMCTTSRYDCIWCPLANTCVFNQPTLCSNYADVAVQNITECPQLDPSDPELLHSGKTKQFTITAKNLLNVANYVCIIDDDEATPLAAIKTMDGSIICNSYTYDYEEEVQEMTVIIRVGWVQNSSLNYIDNERTVTLYKCWVGRGDCSSCRSRLSTPPDYNCTWCSTKECLHESDCKVEETGSCPPPVVNQINPNVVPTSSDSQYVDVITLSGQDLGQYVDDLRIVIGGKSCRIINETYVAGHSIACEAPPFAEIGRQEVIVFVNSIQTLIEIQLEYQTPTLSSSVIPAEGIRSGGTTIIITGENFISVSVNIDTSICTNISYNNSVITCITGGHEEGCWNVMVTFGNVKKSAGQYCYQSDPVIIDYSPKSSIKSGGRIITVNGSNFQYVQDARIRVTIGEDTAETVCRNKTKTLMFCETPIIDTKVMTRKKRQVANNRGVDSDVIFILDGYMSPNVGLTYYSDPVYYTFDNTTSYTGHLDDGFYQLKDDDEYIYLFGFDLTLASTKENKDVRVFVGGVELEVIDLDMEYIKVSIPDEEPASTSIEVAHNNIKVTFGIVRYPTDDLTIMLIIIGALLVFIIVIITIAGRYVHKSRMIKNEVKNIRLEMDELEKTLQDEARQAIADLALGLTDITEDLKGVGMPFLSHRDYACSMFFTGFEIVPDSVEIDERDEDQVKTSALLKFSKLLMDKQFLLVFIRMINSNRQITIREKGNFASLLTVAMIVENKLEYMTDILEILLKEYIEDHVYSKKAKQVLIRNETVTEKLLSNWIALSMYNYLKYHAASPLYLLFQAIKSRIKMGPVDAVTNYSTHSLSIDHILPSGIDVEEISLVVVLNDEDGEQIVVKVLTCDSISQVKVKLIDAMYKNRPYSSRPNIDELDLEWRNGRNGHLVLNDKDVNSIQSGNWQKINTLADFGVTDRSVMALTRTNTDNGDDVQVLVSPTSSNFSKTQGYQNVVLMMPKQFDFQAEEGMSYYHLVKEDDMFDSRDRSQVPKEFKRGQTIQYKRKKMIKEINFPRLVSTKETIQEYVDDMFKAIVKTPSNTHKLPLAIKYLFDLFDEEGAKYDVDSSILKTWKNNSFLARFWVQVITHPNFIFDIGHQRPVEVALDIISRTFLDSCSVVKIKFTKESPVNRLLYTKEIESYRPLVDDFYLSVRKMSDINRSELVKELNEACQNFSGLFSKSSTLFHLYTYAEEHNTKLLKALKEEEVEDDQVAEILKEISAVMKAPTNKNGNMP